MADDVKSQCAQDRRRRLEPSLHFGIPCATDQAPVPGTTPVLTGSPPDDIGRFPHRPVSIDEVTRTWTPGENNDDEAIAANAIGSAENVALLPVLLSMTRAVTDATLPSARLTIRTHAMLDMVMKARSDRAPPRGVGMSLGLSNSRVGCARLKASTRCKNDASQTVRSLRRHVMKTKATQTMNARIAAIEIMAEMEGESANSCEDEAAAERKTTLATELQVDKIVDERIDDVVDRAAIEVLNPGQTRLFGHGKQSGAPLIESIVWKIKPGGQRATQPGPLLIKVAGQTSGTHSPPGADGSVPFGHEKGRGTQLASLDAPGKFVVIPSQHGRQREWSRLLYVPRSHSVQAVALARGAILPGGHGAQTEEPAFAENDPALQPTQKVRPFAPLEFSAVPAGHGEQKDEATEAVKKPSAQSVHFADPGWLQAPGSQRTQSDADAMSSV